MLGYALALVPLYFFIYLPVSSMLHGTAQNPSDRDIVNFNFNVSSIASDEPLSCPPHSYTTHILSHEPLIIYIENFLSADESAHLLKIRYPLFRLKPNIRMSNT
jgi:prolyl 4-hydroxylase